MVSIFPTLTFPNHWALMTGLYAESHGIIANNFWDPESNLEFHYNKISSAWNPDFWLGEPMWETANKAGIITANLMWPGPPKTKSGSTPTYFVPWKDKVPLNVKLDQLLQWIDLPFEERPQLLMAYEPSLDQAGHLTGPMSALVNQTLSQVDLFAAALHDSLADRNLTDIVDIVFVSDHGMTDTSHPTLIYVDDEDMLGEQGLGAIVHEDGWPSMGLRFNSKQNETHYLEKLLHSQHPHAEGFDVYTKETMPSRWHFAHHERIAPVWIVPKIGYALTSRKEGDVGMSKGNHGYDNNEPSMHAMFVAHGPFSAVVKDLHKSSLSAWLPWKNKGWHSTSKDTYVMDTFPNVEVYGLVSKLLGMEEFSSHNNGTKGFWDKYF
jgi:predicted AlkP superfamily pyrophosphatase or phosphodiesterase